MLHFHCTLVALFTFHNKVMLLYYWVIEMSIEILTPSGIFEIIQNATFGELLIGILLTVILAVNVLYFIWRVACREGWI